MVTLLLLTEMRERTKLPTRCGTVRCKNSSAVPSLLLDERVARLATTHTLQFTKVLESDTAVALLLESTSRVLRENVVVEDSK